MHQIVMIQSVNDLQKKTTRNEQTLLTLETIFFYNLVELMKWMPKKEVVVDFCSSLVMISS